MIADVLSTLGDSFSIEQELRPAQYSQSYLLRDQRRKTKHLLSVLSKSFSARVEDVDVFMESLKQYSGLDLTLIELDQGGFTAQQSLYWLSTSLPLDTVPIQQKSDRQKPISAAQISYIGAACCRALAALHTGGRTHGGLVPASVLLSEHRVHISDTGIHTALQLAGIGLEVTPALETRYMSPEQSLTGQATAQSDIYSLGVILYELLTGKPPFGGRTTAAVMASVLVDEAAPSTISRDQKPGYVTSAILRAIEKSPSDRWTSAQQFEQALTRSSKAGALNTVTAHTHGRSGCLLCLSGIFLMSIYALNRYVS